MKIEKIAYFNQPNCYMLSNGTVEVIVTTDIGPRVIAYRFPGGENILAELGPENVEKTEFGEWHPWGGHRLWHAPESKPRSYEPDNDPVDYEIIGDDSILLKQKVEPHTGIRKEMLIRLDPSGSHVMLTHMLINQSYWPVTLAPWGLTIMNGGGTTFFPQEPYIPHGEALLPARPMVLWHYTDLSDPRWTFGSKYIRLRSDPSIDKPLKLGAANKQGWAAYLRGDTLFMKRFPYVHGAVYPDYGCNFETFTRGDFMEIETLGPMVTLDPGQDTTHVEDWYLVSGISAAETEADLEAAVKKAFDQVL